jgi:spermidine synthase
MASIRDFTRQEKHMKPTIKLATARTPDGGEMGLYQHDRDFLININGQELMSSRRHDSEQELARLGCAHLSKHKAACVLVGGLGMGYTLRQALDMLAPDAHVVVSELLQAVVDWNRAYLRDLNGQPLEDKRTELITGDILALLAQSNNRFDAILLDVDNGPSAITDAGNQHLYSPTGIQACRGALRHPGCLAIWSAVPSKGFERLLIRYGFHVRRYRGKTYPGGTSKPLFIWVATEDESILPPGGGKPRLPG